MQINILFKYRKVTSLTILLFVLALGVRLLYQGESIVDRPIRADAARYVSTAYNFKKFAIYSDEIPRWDKQIPITSTDIPPAYPLFLSFFIEDDIDIDKTLKVQALMGAFTSVLTFFIARMILTWPWAFFAGILTALSPHLIAMDYFLLTESFYTFVTLLATLLLLISWKSNKPVLTAFAAALFAFSAHIRAINLFLVFFLSLIFLFDAKAYRLSPKLNCIKHVCAVILGVLVIAGIYKVFSDFTSENHNSLLKSAGKETVAESISLSDSYYDIENILLNIKNSFRPPDFYIKEESHLRFNHNNSDYLEPTASSFKDNYISYIKWNLWGRMFFMNHWDNVYNSDVYIYPMIRKGFEENLFLRFVHRTMRLVHGATCLLSLFAPLFLIIKWKRKALSAENRMAIVIVMEFVYFIVTLSLVNAWLPRYSIPIRPFSYILALIILSWVISSVKELKFVYQPSNKL